jgi:hypothetical protein
MAIVSFAGGYVRSHNSLGMISYKHCCMTLYGESQKSHSPLEEALLSIYLLVYFKGHMLFSKLDTVLSGH